MAEKRGFSVATTCETVDDFIESYRHRTTADTIFVQTVDTNVVGNECAFAILLANRRPVLAGTCVVLDVFTDENNPFNRRGMRLGIKRMGPDSQRVFEALEAARELDQDPDTNVFEEPDTLVRPPRAPRGTDAPEPRTFGTSTANPLTELTDASLEGLVECRLYEAPEEKD